MKTNETNTPEPLAAILAEMREWSTDENDALARYADRIEAAVERRVKEAKDGIWRNAEEIHDIHCNDCTFRAALYKIVKLAPEYTADGADWNVLGAEAFLTAFDALHLHKPTPKSQKFDEAAFDAATSKPNGWSDVADPVAEIRRMRDGDAPGNAAAMREALERCNELFRCDDDNKSRLCNLARKADEATQAALAAPPRNCDRPECATAEGAISALRANPCANHDFCKEQLDCAECATRWLIAQAKKGGEK
jgi:hypothetical protein